MLDESRKKQLQFIGGGIIIACAFAIMLPGFLSYAFGLGRVITLILLVIVSSWVVAFSFNKFRARGGSTPSSTTNSKDE